MNPFHQQPNFAFAAADDADLDDAPARRGRRLGVGWMAMGGRPHGRPRPPFGPPFGGFGRGFGRGQRARRGDIRSAVLVLLSEQPMHGYQIIQELGTRSGGAWRPSPGSVYPALQLLEDEGLVTAVEDAGKRVFQLTDAGRAEVETHNLQANPPWQAVANDVDDRIAALHDTVGQLGLAALQVSQAGSDDQVARAQQVLAEARRALYAILAEEPPAR
jgi:DNA-binding PadR family transcriptional regulator